MAPRGQTSCDGGYDHKHNDVVHYFGCLTDKINEREDFLKQLPDKIKRRIAEEKARIARHRSRFEAEGPTTEVGKLLISFKQSLAHWRSKSANPPGIFHAPIPPPPLEPEDDPDLKATMVFFKDSKPYDHPDYPDKFPNQKIAIKTLLYETDKKKNPLASDYDRDEGMIRYFHLPANNMHWVEEAIARHYNEATPDLNSPFQKPKPNEDSRTKMLLRPRFWRNLQHGTRSDLPVHARHMRPRCYVISTDPVKTIPMPKNLVLFMPYLHWETDRKRGKCTETITKTRKAKLSSMGDVVDAALNIPQITISNRVTSDGGIEPVVTNLRPKSGQKVTHATREGQTILGQILMRAAALVEAMDYDTDHRLIQKYLDHQPPLHPRRTLDQSYYWTLKDTRARDRDQVVYRGTAPRKHPNCARKDPENSAACSQCNEDIRKVPRVLMVDQLWMFVLDETTIITSFPRRYGRNKPDPSAVQKSIRARLRSAREDEIKSVWDLAIIIIDQCSRVFFDRTQPADFQPLALDTFANAIGRITHSQSNAYEHFWELSRLASAIYNSRDEVESASHQKRLLDINPEGTLLREIKDILDELYIITLIKTQQLYVAQTFYKHVRKIQLNPIPRTPRSPSIDIRRGTITELSLSANLHRPGSQLESTDPLDWTTECCLDLIDSMKNQLAELDYLKVAAEHTSAGIKDLLALKQQQAGVVEAREAVKQAEETLRQGRSIMLFTIVTIVFLPLSFFTSIFSMNATELNGAGSLLSLKEEFAFMWPFSIVIITASLVVAFSNFIRAVLSYLTAISWTWLVTKTPLYIWWHHRKYNSTGLKATERKIVAKMKINAILADKRRRENEKREREEKAAELERARNPGGLSLVGRAGGSLGADVEMGHIVSGASRASRASRASGAGTVGDGRHLSVQSSRPRPGRSVS